MAILEDDRLVELLVDRPDIRRTVGNIYRGKVEAVLPGMQAAFVDVASEKSAFLHASDLVEPDDEELEDDNGNARSSRRYRKLPNIRDHLQRGQTLLVQVTKEAIGTKGPRVTAQISLPGRCLVYMPFASKIGVSRKIDSREERERLRRIVEKHFPEKAGGVIIRTAAEDVSEGLIKRELQSLLGQWNKVKRKAGLVRAPALVQREASLTSGIIRDLLSDKVDKLCVDSEQLLKEIKQYLRQVDPDLLELVTPYKDSTPLFDHFDIESEIRNLFDRRVDLPMGGYLIVESTEALISIDVNTGRYTGRKDPEATILRTNLEAAQEITRQLRLRDIGGIIVIDFIDMESYANRERVLHELRTHVGRDRARTRVFGMSELGLVEMTRQRVRPSLWQTTTTSCPACDGTGRVFRPEVVVRQLEQALTRVANEKRESHMLLRLHPEVALHLLEADPRFLKEISESTGIDLEIRDDPSMELDGFRLVSQPAGRDVTERYAVA